MDINEEAEKSLKKTGYNVVFYYPQSFSTLPVISFYTLKECGTFACDNREYFRDGTISADIWAKTPKQAVQIYADVRRCLCKDGWTEIFSADIPRGEKNVYHRSARFTKSFYTE